MILKKVLKNFLQGVMPSTTWHAIQKTKAKHFNPSYYKFYYEKQRPTLQKNEQLKNIHKNQRCFILGTGSSINKQNLLPLKDEICIFLNEFYYHKQYKELCPKYHLQSGFGLHQEAVSYELACRWFHELERSIPHTTSLLLPYHDYDFVQKNNVFKNHATYFINPLKNILTLDKEHIDLSQDIYATNNVVGLAVQVAIYMGFKEIYLLGCDHTWLENFVNEYNYFYNNKPFPEHTIHFYPEKKSIVPSYLDREPPPNVITHLESVLAMWKQYEALQTEANKNNTTIYNATAGGFLDVFPRINFSDLFRTKT